MVYVSHLVLVCKTLKHVLMKILFNIIPRVFLLLARETYSWSDFKPYGWMIFDAIEHFTVVCSVTWPLDDREAGVDLVLIQTTLLLWCKCTLVSIRTTCFTQQKSEVCIKTRSTPASQASKGQHTEQTTVKWSIVFFIWLLCCVIIVIDVQDGDKFTVQRTGNH